MKHLVKTRDESVSLIVDHNDHVTGAKLKNGGVLSMYDIFELPSVHQLVHEHDRRRNENLRESK